VRYSGWYSNVSRRRRRKGRDARLAAQLSSRDEPDGLTPDEPGRGGERGLVSFEECTKLTR